MGTGIKKLFDEYSRFIIQKWVWIAICVLFFIQTVKINFYKINLTRSIFSKEPGKASSKKFRRFF